MNLLAIFFTGLLTGGLTCLAVQGGLLATTLAQRQDDRNTLPVLFFLLAKLVVYTLFGALLGLFGSAFQLSLTTQIILQIIIGIFMIGTALNLLEVHPVFRYFLIQPPHFLTRRIRKTAKSGNVFTPVILGAATVFIPCGTTQAMMALALASANPWKGASIMFAFILGTSPLFYLVGFIATKIGDLFKTKFMKIAAFAVIAIAVFNLNNAIALTGSKYTLDYILSDLYCTVSGLCGSVAGAQTEISNEININIVNTGYSPDYFAVKKGSPVILHLSNISRGGCQQVFTIPSLGIQKVVRPGNNATIQFTAPGEPGEIAFMCGMGMYRGKIQVI